MNIVKVCTLFVLAIAIHSCDKLEYQSFRKRIVSTVDRNQTDLADGRSIRSIKTNTTQTQVLQGQSSSTIATASVKFSPGALNIDTNITLEEGASLAEQSFFSELGASGVTASKSAPAVVVTAEHSIDPVGSLAISVPLPEIPASLQLTEADTYSLLVILYRLKVATTGEYRVGFIPRSALEINADQKVASFSASYFGSFQAVFLNTSLAEPIEVKSSVPIATKRDTATTPTPTPEPTPSNGGTNDTVAPIVDAGSDKTVRTVTLQDATATDSSALTYEWSKVSGPGTLTFSAVNAEDTTISANTDGTYVVRLTATDSAGNSGSDTLTFVWDATSPMIEAGTSKIAKTAATQDATVSDATALTFQWSKVSGPGTLTFSAATYEDTLISADADGSYVVRLTATDAAGNSASDTLTFVWDTTAPVVNAGTDKTISTATPQDATVSDSTAVTYAWSKVSGPGTLTFSAATSEDTSISADTAGNYVLRLTATDAAGNSASDTMALVWVSGSPVVNAGADKTVKTATLQDATVSDVSALTYQWSKVSGPGTLTFSAPTAEDTTISADIDGTYVVQLTATNAGNSSASDTINFVWDTTAPTVNAGTDKIAKIATSQDATATDASALTYQWSQDSGPGTLTFSAATAEDTSISASTEGTYVVRFTATDAAGNSASDTVTFIWDTTAPAVNAGLDKAVNANTLQDATVTDATALTYQWNMDSGPGTLTFSASTAEDTSISANANGTYVVSLTATDAAGNSASDTLNFVWDATAPTVSSVTGTNGYRKAGDLLSITVTFSEAVTVSGGSPQLTLETGTVDQIATYSSGSGTTALTFTYTVQAGDTADDLDYTTTSALALGGATITDSVGNNADLTLPAPASSGSLGFNNTIIVDTTLPAAITTADPVASGGNPVSISWSGGSDTHFDTFNVKACTDNGCLANCAGEATAAASPGSLTGLSVGSVYHICVEAVDLSGNSTGWTASANTISVILEPYGNGLDGDVTLSGATDTSDATHLLRTLAASYKVVSIAANGNDYDLALGSTYTNNNQYKIGDEVMWYVHSAGSTGCSADRGKYGFTTVTAVDGANSLVRIADNINIAMNSSAPTSANHCSVQLIRVPQFNNLTLAAGASLAAVKHNEAAGTGGVLVLRVKAVLSLSGGSGVLSAAEKGYSRGEGARLPGSGIAGVYSTEFYYANGNGGGGADAAAGHSASGGGNAGTGETQAEGSLVGTGGLKVSDATLQNCVSGFCDPTVAIFMGGGGGSASTILGGHGGGVVMLFANAVENGNLTINANGGNAQSYTGSTGGVGGGAGGSIYFKAGSMTSGTALSSFTLTADGGASSSDTAPQAGAGGGGLIKIDAGSCPVTANFSAALGDSTGGVGEATGGTAGVYGVDDPSLGVCP
jgi:hypothetical protein